MAIGPGIFDCYSLLGLTQTQAEAEFLRLAGGGGELTSKSFKDVTYITDKSLGLSLRFKPAVNGKADVVFMYNEDKATGFKPYLAGPLPFGLAWSSVSRDVVETLGEPSDKFGGGRLQPCAIAYETMGIDITFQRKNWDDSANPLGVVSIFKEVSPSEGLCSQCGKLAKFRCSKCNGPRYCGATCQRKDWNAHKQICGNEAGAVAAEEEPADPMADLKRQIAEKLGAKITSRTQDTIAELSAASESVPGPSLREVVPQFLQEIPSFEDEVNNVVQNSGAAVQGGFLLQAAKTPPAAQSISLLEAMD